MTKATDDWMPLYIAAYIRDTGRLSTEGHGAYLLLLMDYWISGPPVDNDDVLAAITRLPLPRWRKLRPLIEPFFTIEDGRWRQKRAEHEKERAGKISAQRRAAAEERWERQRSKRDADAYAKPESKPDAKAYAARDAAQDAGTDANGMTNNREPRTGSIQPTTVSDTPRAVAPAASSSDRRRSETDEIAAEFLRLREQGWPSESRLPSPLVTLRTQALAWLDAGGTVDLCKSVMARVVEEKRARGEPAPTNLGFCRLSVESAIAKATADGQAAPAVQPGRDPELARLEQTPGTPEWSWARAVERWSALGGKGPMPSLDEFRAKAKGAA